MFRDMHRILALLYHVQTQRTERELSHMYEYLQGELSHMRAGHYVIGASSVKIKVWVIGQIPSDLTLSLLRDFQQREVSKERNYRVIRRLYNQTQGTITVTSVISLCSQRLYRVPVI